MKIEAEHSEESRLIGLSHNLEPKIERVTEIKVDFNSSADAKIIISNVLFVMGVTGFVAEIHKNNYNLAWIVLFSLVLGGGALVRLYPNE